MTALPNVLLCCNTTVREEYAVGEGVARLERLAHWAWLPAEGTSTRPGVWGGASEDPADASRLREALGAGIDALIVCHGAPYVDASVLAGATGLRFVGELEGDRFANRIDTEACAARGLSTPRTGRRCRWLNGRSG